MSSPESFRPRHLQALLIIVLLFAAIAGYLYWPKPPPKLTHELRLRQIQSLPDDPSEEKWMAAQIGQQIAETVVFAQSKGLPQAAGLTFSVARPTWNEQYVFVAGLRGGPEVRNDVVLADYFWSPANFIPWTQHLLAAWKVPASSVAPADLEIFRRLATPRSDILVREDQRISEALSKAPLDPQLHEEAALLVGSFILREAAADFCDTRRELCAISAHLALARAIRPQSGSAGELAEAILCILSGREAAASQILDRLRLTAEAPGGMTTESARTWERALQMRNTGDYRLLSEPGSYSLLERLEYFRTVRNIIGTVAAESYLDKSSPEKLAEWPIVIMAGGITVADGNRWAESAVRGNLEEAESEYQSYFGKPPSRGELVSALNAKPAHFVLDPEKHPSYQVLGWGSWAGFRQRQLCSLLDKIWSWLDGHLGLPDQAKDFQQKLASQFRSLTLYPLVKFFDPEKDRKAKQRWAEAAQQLLLQHPDRVSFWLGHETGPATKRWFRPVLPFGTTYDLGSRNAWHPFQGLKPPEFDQLKAIAPHNYIVLNEHAKAIHPPAPTSAQLLDEFAPIMYNTYALWRIANVAKEEPALYQSVFDKLCQLDADYYTILGQYLVDHNLPEAAVTAYQNAVDRAPDRVGVANSCRWLADYYYDHGRHEEARAIAEMAADVYSWSGLQTAAHIMERDQRFDEAEELLRKQAERYQTSGGLAAFYARHRQAKPQYAKQYDKYLPEIFPGGMPALDPASLKNAPAHGVVLRTTGPNAAKIGLRIGDVIVAINSTPITNMDQYYFVIDSATDSHIRFTAWNGRSYITASADLPDHRLGVDLYPLRR
jgi:tetratricopeptide (TPR) repeat protein